MRAGVGREGERMQASGLDCVRVGAWRPGAHTAAVGHVLEPAELREDQLGQRHRVRSAALELVLVLGEGLEELLREVRLHSLALEQKPHQAVRHAAERAAQSAGRASGARSRRVHREERGAQGLGVGPGVGEGGDELVLDAGLPHGVAHVLAKHPPISHQEGTLGGAGEARRLEERVWDFDGRRRGRSGVLRSRMGLVLVMVLYARVLVGGAPGRALRHR